MESWSAINKGSMPLLSEQQIVDCTSNSGCGGGYITGSLAYAGSTGLCAGAAYPYTSSKGACRASSCAVVTRTNGYRSASASQASVESALRLTPVVVAVDAGGQAWQFYRSGVVSASTCGTALNHAVLLVGMGSDAATSASFWRIKNSWGASWGEAGYIRLARGAGTGTAGTCGILLQAAYPV